MSHKVKAIKHLMNTYQGEIREVYCCWQLIRERMPRPWAGAWYDKQYAPSDYKNGFNMCICPGSNENEHWERRSGGFSLMRLADLYNDDFSMEIIHEYYTSLKVTVKKRSRSRC